MTDAPTTPPVRVEFPFPLDPPPPRDTGSDAALQARFQVIPYPGTKLLYQEATGLEKAWADTDAERIINLPDWVITDQWDPYLISYNNLPYLAWGMGVNLWEDDYWNEGKKRDWVRFQWDYKAVRGAPRAFRLALWVSDYDVTDMVRPPQGFYASPELTKEEWDWWINQMPELRITWAKRQGTRGFDEFFAEDEDWQMEQVGLPGEPALVGFSDQDAVSIDDGPALYGRFAIIRHHDVDYPVYRLDYRPGGREDPTVDFERWSTEGKAGEAFMTDEGYVEDEATGLCCAELLVPHIYTIRFDRSYSHSLSVMGLTTIVPSLEPLTPRYERNSDIGWGDSMFFSDEYSDWFYADQPDGGDLLMADRVFLLDPEVQEPMNEGVSFADVSRVGIPVFYGELQVDLHTHEAGRACFSDASFLEDFFAIPEDRSHMERAFRAIVDAKALRDTVAVSFAPRRPLLCGDYVQDEYTYDYWIRDPL